MRLTNDCINTFISVPNIFIDNYMSKASGEFVKVYLYLLRCMQSGLDVSLPDIATYCNLTENDILCALIYWDKANVLALEMDENAISGIHFLDLNATTEKKAEMPVSVPSHTEKLSNTESISNTEKPSTTEIISHTETVSNIELPSTTETVSNITATKETIPTENQTPITTEPKTISSADIEYTLDEIKTFRNNPDISELLFILEAYIKRTLSSVEMNVVFFWIDELKFSKELAEYLIEYCVSGGHISLRYMEKVAINWAQQNISTVEQAKQISAFRSKAYYTIVKSFGINGRNLTEIEIEFLTKWTKTYGFDLEIIQEACKRTISAIQKPSFEYADSILTSWKEKNVHTLTDISKADTDFNKTKKSASSANHITTNAHRNKFNNFDQRTYDFDELEKLFLTTSVP